MLDSGKSYSLHTRADNQELTNHRSAEFGTSVLLSGPASAGEPLPGYTWWQNFAAFIAKNNSVPDQYAWHMEGGGGDLLSDNGGLVEILNNYSLPMRPININEYGTAPEQVCTVLFHTAFGLVLLQSKV